MEEILNKDIFDGNQLSKLNPDYDPSDIVLRMQMRRNMIKDTHGQIHGCTKNGFHRKYVQKKTLKDTVKVNKELIKLKNTFNNRNLRNEIILKHSRTSKQLDSNNAKQQSLINYGLLPKLNDSSAITDEVVLNDEYDNIDLDCSQVFKSNPSQSDKNEVGNCPLHLRNKKEKVYLKSSQTNGYENNDNNINSVTGQVEETTQPICDLQSLLIMMAITSKETDKEVERQIKNATNELEEEIINDMPVEIDNVNFLNIVPLKSKIFLKHETLMKKYVDKWKLYVKNKKNYMEQIRISAINNFFEKLDKRKSNSDNKAKQSVYDYNTYQHRYKVQKHIIALQKAKLEEQNRQIEELKYNKIVEASKQSVDTMKEQVRRTYFEIDRQLKPKIKCLTNELNLHEIEEPSLILHCLKVPQFLQRMEKRAREREEKHAIIRERRRQKEEERLRLKQQAELAKAEMDKEEKIKRIKELKEKRKREKVEGIRKKQHAERMRALVVMADLHNERNILYNYGLRPWLSLIKIKKDNMERAKNHYTFQLRKNSFFHWMWYTEDTWFDRNYKAEDHYRKKLLQKVFNAFKQNLVSYTLKKQVAEDYYEIYLLQFAYRKFKAGVSILKDENELKLAKAEAYYKCNILFKAFTLWRTLPALNDLKREQDARKLRWRQKVLQVVPDYVPPED